ncbi:MAG TPA: hypothetical protein VFJ77_11630 [Gaiellaceae bacterium]|nr:hypothetical protein [Gaiellaceae bacterium]
MLAATPPFECGPGYASPASPLHAGALAVGCVLAGAAGLLVATGMALVSPRGSATRSGALRALGLAALALALAGGALVVELFRWTCWP